MESILNLLNFQISLKNIFEILPLVYSYQWISGLVLIKCSHFGPVVLFEQSQSWLIELILGRNNSEEVWEAPCREHWMSVRVSYLQIDYKRIRHLYHLLAFSSEFTQLFEGQILVVFYKNSFDVRVWIIKSKSIIINFSPSTSEWDFC